MRSKLFDQIIGQAENSWLEFKSYVDLSDDAGEIKLAQNVARFANSEQGGIIIVGFRTTSRDREDVASKLTPVLTSDNHPKRYAGVIDRRIFPPVRGLSIERIDATPARCVVLLQIPAQSEDDKPFLVHGAIVDGKVEGAFFSIVRRRGEDSVRITAQDIHAYINAGKRLSAIIPVLHESQDSTSDERE